MTTPTDRVSAEEPALIEEQTLRYMASIEYYRTRQWDLLAAANRIHALQTELANQQNATTRETAEAGYWQERAERAEAELAATQKELAAAREALKAAREFVGNVRCEYPEDPCATAKGIEVFCDTCQAAQDKLRALAAKEGG